MLRNSLKILLSVSKRHLKVYPGRKKIEMKNKRLWVRDLLNSLAILFLCSLTLLTFAAKQGDYKIVIGHCGGGAGYVPENTLVSFAIGYTAGADYIETDLVLTKDNVFICLHDIYLDYTTNVAEVFPDRHRADGHWYAIDFTLNEIKQLRVHERCKEDGIPFFPGRFPTNISEFEIPTLDEMIELMQGLNKSTGRNVGLYLELKKPNWHLKEGKPMEKKLLDVLNRYGYKGENVKAYIECFDPSSLKKLRFELGTNLPLIQLVGSGGSFSSMWTKEGLKEISAYANGIGPSKWIIEKNPAYVLWAHDSRLVVHPYTFRADDLLPGVYQTFEQELYRFYFVYNVDGVITDFADKAVQFLRACRIKK